MSRRITPSWEKPRDYDGIHSPQGIEQLKKEVKYGLQKKYKGLAETMFRWEFPEEGFEDMITMSYGLVPELFMMKNGQAVWFMDDRTGQYHCLPLVMKGGVNMYGRMVEWSPVPVGYTDTTGPQQRNEALTYIRNMKLNAENSVVMLNDRHGGNDEGFIDAMIDELVDNILTTNQLQLLAKAPYFFNVSEDNVLTAKNIFLAIAENSPAIFTNLLGEDSRPVLETAQVQIDPALFEIFDRFECQILEYIGFPCIPITKRAQQTVSEVTENDDKIRIRRMEKLKQRELACEQMKKVFGVEVHVYSVIDEHEEEEDRREELESADDRMATDAQGNDSAEE